MWQEVLAAELQALRRKDAADRAARQARSEEFRAEERRKKLLAQQTKARERLFQG